MRFLLLLILIAGTAAAEPEYRMQMRLRDSDLALRTAVRVEVQVTETEGCLYIPSEDPRLQDIMKLEALQTRSALDNALHQDTELTWVERANLAALSPALYRFPKEGGRLVYDLVLPGWKDRLDSPRILKLWHPVILERCPASGEEAFAVPWKAARFRVAIESPEGWKVLAPGEKQGSEQIYSGRSFSAAIYKKGNALTEEANGMRILSLSESDNFRFLASYVARAAGFFSRLTGAQPERDLLLIEMPDYEPSRSPGLLTLNRPQQAGMRYLQQDFTNWTVWTLSILMSQQWFGMGCRSNSVDSHWLVQGLADALTSMLLEHEREYFDFFSRDSSGRPWLDLNYRQAQDMGAASLNLLYPGSSLTQLDDSPRPASLDRPFHIYLRHGLMLRYLRWRMGNESFKNFLQDLTAGCQTKSLSTESFLQKLRDRLQDERLVNLVREYWSSDDWPDVALGSVSRDEASGRARVEMQYMNDLRFPVDLWVTTEDGERHLYFIEPNGASTVSVPLNETEESIKKLEINPSRSLFDSNRYNNKSGFPKFSLFPGSARGLADDEYTLLWIPFLTKLPGEPLTFQLAWQVFRYLDAGVSGIVNYQSEDNRAGFKLLFMKALPRQSLYMLAKVAQDDNKKHEGERILDVTLQRRKFFLQLMTGSTRVRSRQVLGRPESKHLTSAFTLFWKTEPGKTCGFDLTGEAEQSVWVPSKDFDYLRSFGMSRGGCDGKNFGAHYRLFWGGLRSHGPLPSSVKFRAQDLDEAHVRLDKPSIEDAERIEAVNIDLAFPARLPLPTSWFVLPRRSRFSLFWDAARLHGPDKDVVSSGVGYSLPLGGDVAGKDTVTFLRFTVNAVLYRRLDHEVNDKPGVLFDFAGDL